MTDDTLSDAGSYKFGRDSPPASWPEPLNTGL